MLSEIRKILKITGDGRRYLWLILLRSPISILLAIVNAVFLQQAFNAIAQDSSAGLTAVCIDFGIASICTFLYNGVVWSACAAPLVARMESTLRVKLFRKIASLPYERVEARSQGDWLTRLNTDVQTPFSQAWPNIAIASVNVCASAVLLWWINPGVLGYILLFVVPHIAFSQFVVARAMPGLNRKALEATAVNTDDFTTLITCADAAALYDAQDYLVKRFEESSLQLFRANMKMRARNALGAGILPLFGLGGYVTLLVAGSRWIAQGVVTFGDLTSALQYRGGVLIGSLTLINCLISIQGSLAGIGRLNETMSEKQEE